MTLRTPFSLINSNFNQFLFAPIGDEANGMSLSVISALTRLDLDPWKEAARLAAMPPAIAAQALAPIIAQLPLGKWALLDTRKIADRLIALLPEGAMLTASQPERRARETRNSAIGVWLICLLLGAALLGVAVNRGLNPARERASAPVSGAVSPPLVQE